MAEQLLPAEYEEQLAQFRRQQAIAQALQQRAMQPIMPQQVGPVASKANPLAFLAQIGSGYVASKNAKDAETGMAGVRKKAATDQSTELGSLLQNPDIKAAIAASLQSRFPGIQAWGQGRQKTMDDRLTKGAEMVGREDPGAGVAALNAGQLPSNYVPSPSPDPKWGSTPEGIPTVTNTSRFGAKTGSFGSLPSKVSQTVETSTVPKANLKLHEKSIEAILPGGDSYKEAASARKSLNSIQESVAQVAAGAQTGGPEPYIQVLRSWGESIGLQNAATAPSATLSALLKKRTFESLGGLGAQISDADRRFVSEFSGDLATNPAALKRMLAIQAAADVKIIQNHNHRLKALEAVEGLDPNLLNVNRVNMEFTGGADNEFSGMFDRVYQGKPSVDAKSPAAPAATSRPMFSDPAKQKRYEEWKASQPK